ncbi:helix-turn-helix DNA-binding domain protein [Arthrobacter phage Kepler]|uniref:Helix-turn-helix DNA-binding domain protein n=2 Tax=Coralvirus TaxID=2733171 RepID=A0A3G2KH39_9CAUD|nr:DNA binding protein [Arthrobacter phage Kepler]AYN58271.1 helix-turn-helix DNA-binding domain protein [Arthrobacter phage Kepler]AYN58798.1 helix-turn-helix DNA-binding domain protein [Arthrobacter phage Polka]
MNTKQEDKMKTRKAAARRTDPGTSHAAAAGISVRRMSTVRSRVLAILTASDRATKNGGLTHDEIIAEYKGYALRLGWPRATDSSIRTRCKELWRDGAVEQVEGAAGRSGMGNAAILWRAAAVQISETVGDKEETA